MASDPVTLSEQSIADLEKISRSQTDRVVQSIDRSRDAIVESVSGIASSIELAIAGLALELTTAIGALGVDIDTVVGVSTTAITGVLTLQTADIMSGLANQTETINSVIQNPSGLASPTMYHYGDTYNAENDIGDRETHATIPAVTTTRIWTNPLNQRLITFDHPNGTSNYQIIGDYKQPVIVPSEVISFPVAGLGEIMVKLISPV